MTNRQGSGEVTYRLRKDHFSKKGITEETLEQNNRTPS